MKRDWRAMRAKVEREGCCRACGATFQIEAAHIIPRSRVKPGEGEDPRNCVPLCRRCHVEFDTGTLDILGCLSREEQAYAVGLVGLEEARRRLTNEREAA